MKADNHISPLSRKARFFKLTDYVKTCKGIIPISDPRVRSALGTSNILSRMKTGAAYRISQNVRYHGYALMHNYIQRRALKMDEVAVYPIGITELAKILNRRRRYARIPKRREKK